MRSDQSPARPLRRAMPSSAPPRVRAALYRLIENLPGIESLGPMTDKLGRHGIGVGFTQYGVRDMLIGLSYRALAPR
jgi:hypothetical protein